MQRLRSLSPAALVAAIVLISTAGGATAGTLITSAQIKNGTIREADLNTNLKSKLAVTAHAKVDQNGNLLAGRGVRSVTKTAAGDYLVRFKRSVDKCANVAGVRDVLGNEFHGLVVTYNPAPDTVRVGTLTRVDGVHADGNGFNLIVVC